MLPALLLLLQSAGDPGPVYDGRARRLDVRLPRIDTAVTVDGRLDEPVWQQAAVLTGFSEYRPVDSRPAADSTQVLAGYAPDAIYFGVRAFEAHGTVVRATLADRDNIDRDDRIHILLDTYHDHRRALLFAVNPLGVQQDGVWSDGVDAGAAGGPSAGGRFDATIDLNPDFVFQSCGHVTPWGFEVEVRIPFKSLRYQSADPQDWGLQSERITQHNGYEDTGTPAVRASASFLIQSGKIVGLTGLHRGVVMDMTPDFTTRAEGRPATPQYLYTGRPELGGTLRWGLTQNLNLTGTANPDFSQVEADVGQVTVNQRFALFFPEKRPFFLEGLEQFDTPNRLIYTRQITQPVAGAKLTGKAGGMNVAYLAAVDQTDAVTDAHPVFNLLRLRRDLGASSTLGVAYTDRIDGSAYNRVLGSDVRVLWRKLWFSSVQLVGSWTLDGGGPRAGKLWDVTFADRTGRSYGNHYSLQGVSPDFKAASGFVNRTGYVTARVANRLTWYGRDAEPHAHAGCEFRLWRRAHLRGRQRGSSVQRRAHRHVASHRVAACGGVVDTPAHHAGQGRQALFHRGYPSREARVPIDPRDLLPLHRPVLRPEPGRARRPAHRAATARLRPRLRPVRRRPGQHRQRFPQRRAVLL